MDTIIYSEELTNLAKDFTLKYWNIHLNIPVCINQNLSRRLGSYVFKKNNNMPVRIEINSRICNDKNILKDVLLHELAHWYCHSFLKSGWTHHSNNFIEQSKNMGFPLFRIER